MAGATPTITVAVAKAGPLERLRKTDGGPRLRGGDKLSWPDHPGSARQIVTVHRPREQTPGLERSG